MQKSYIVISGVLPHVYELPWRWETRGNGRDFLGERSQKYLFMMESFFSKLMAFVEKKKNEFDIQVIYYLGRTS